MFLPIHTSVALFSKGLALATSTSGCTGWIFVIPERSSRCGSALHVTLVSAQLISGTLRIAVQIYSLVFSLLQTLVLRCRNPTSSELQDAPPDEVALYPMVRVKTLRIRHAPALTKVILRNCLLPWDADIYSRLKHLELQVGGPCAKLESEQLPTHNQLHRLISSLVKIEELALGVFPDYDGVVDAEPITLPPSCRRVTLRMTARSQVVYCRQLAASLVLPPDATFILSQVCRGDTGQIVERFAGASHPPQALSICTAADHKNKNIVDMITMPFRSGAWLESPAALLTSTPTGHIIFRMEGAARQNMIAALSRIDYSELKILRIPGLRDAHDAKRLLSGDEEYFDGMISFSGIAGDAGPVLGRASKLEVLVAPLTDREVLSELESIVETDGHRSPYPLLRTMIQPPLARLNDEE
ncbi:hypothetical protein PENSPDRAFT_739020 [Peniophora sp. CONT]|nr:hypothetical protein PENSPDRAFT_739020 [Peniophora sp. CONT]